MAAAPPLLSIRGTWAALRIPTAQDWLFSAKAALAMGLSLLIGFSQNLENPYWSALTVYVLLGQPAAGAVRSKALFRFAGTLLGGAGAIVLAALFASHLGVLLIATIIAVLAAFYAKMLDRTPASYAWFATALTLAVVGIAQIQAPASIFMLATARMAEICLAIVMIGLVDSVIAPRAATPVFVAAMTAWRDKAGDWAAAALSPDASQAPAERRRRRQALHRVTALLGALDAFAVQLPWDIVAVPPRARDLRFLRLTVAHVIAHCASANVWIEAAHGESADQIGEVRAWLLERPAFADRAVLDHAVRGDRLRDRLAACEPAVPREALLRTTMLLRLAELVDHWTRIDRTLHAMATGTALDPALRRAARQARPVRSIDYVLGLCDVAPMALALGLGAVLWYWTTWTGSIPAMLFVFISLGFILGTPGALQSARGIVAWIAVTCVLALVYQFAVLPRVTAFPVLIAALLVAVLPLGVMMTMSPAALLIIANGFAFLALQNAYAADFGATLENLLGSLAGCLFAVGALYLCRFDRVRFQARRLARAQRRDLSDIARGRRVPSRDRLLSLGVDRMALFFGLVDGLPACDPLHREDMVDHFRLAANLARLREEARTLSPEVRDCVRALCAAIGDRAALLANVERTLDAVAELPAGTARGHALTALTGLRVSLALAPVFA